MLNETISEKILSALRGRVLSTSMVARKTRLSRITVSKYLSAMEGRHLVQAVPVGKAIAWRAYEHKPRIAILAKTGTARMVKLSLGDEYRYVIGTSLAVTADAFVLVTDNPSYVDASPIPVILIGFEHEDAWCVPDLFDPSFLHALTRTLQLETTMQPVAASAHIAITHLDELEDSLGIFAADDLVTLTTRMLRECRVHARPVSRSAFAIEGPLPDGVLLDIEQTFHLILAHLYGRMVEPGEKITDDGEEHTVPSLAIIVDDKQQSL